MLVKTEVKITEVELENGLVLTVGDEYEDKGIIISIEAGEEFEKEIKDWDFEDWDENVIPASEVKLVLHMRDGEDGWSVYLTGDGTEVIEA